MSIHDSVNLAGVPLVQAPERCLERESPACGDARRNFFQHEFARPKSGLPRREGRQSPRNQVGIDKPFTTRLVGKKRLCKRGLPRAVGTGNDYDLSGAHAGGFYRCLRES